ncbi:MAG: DUF2085 domain-containing protein [Chloroflexota bacterium]|nr:DUF2085 domain-containing protein [Chloroflexota bacterium]
MNKIAEPLREYGPDPLSTRIVIRLDRWIYHFSAHWLTAFNGVSIAVILAVILAPVFRSATWDGAANAIYRAFSGVCHQDPERSFQIAGHSFACCERCAAIYGSLAVFGVLYGLVGAKIRRPRVPELIALGSPVVLDGMAVGSGMYDGSVIVRVITGTLFSLALIWALYPRFDAGFTGMRDRIETLFERLVTQGRASPL